MKKLFFALAITSALISCKKTSTTPNSTTNNSSNSGTCVDNPNINFTSIGTPIGKLDSCIKDIDGNVYKTVTIGTQTWMAENLKTSKYRDGNPIPYVIDTAKWNHLTTGAWCYPNNDKNKNAIYGKLYNWYAVSSTTNGNKNVCPTGWHVPTDSEWTVLTDYLGGASVAGGKMKEVGTTNWNNPNTDATNTSLFTALPGGLLTKYGSSVYLGLLGCWWSTTESQQNDRVAGSRFIGNDYGRVGIFIDPKEDGLSIRCLKD